MSTVSLGLEVGLDNNLLRPRAAPNSVVRTKICLNCCIVADVAGTAVERGGHVWTADKCNDFAIKFLRSCLERVDFTALRDTVASRNTLRLHLQHTIG